MAKPLCLSGHCHETIADAECCIWTNCSHHFGSPKFPLQLQQLNNSLLQQLLHLSALRQVFDPFSSSWVQLAQRLLEQVSSLVGSVSRGFPDQGVVTVAHANRLVDQFQDLGSHSLQLFAYSNSLTHSLSFPNCCERRRGAHRGPMVGCLCRRNPGECHERQKPSDRPLEQRATISKRPIICDHEIRKHHEAS